jgi:hypothetical protein
MVFAFLGLKNFASCPHFDFEPCSWSGIMYEQGADSFFDRNTETAHRWFENHAQNFSQGIERILSSPW